ncbi:MAG: right-handed parallel beta-helix repeat-containing protein [Nannocystaceae bacterium]
MRYRWLPLALLLPACAGDDAATASDTATPGATTTSSTSTTTGAATTTTGAGETETSTATTGDATGTSTTTTDATTDASTSDTGDTTTTGGVDECGAPATFEDGKTPSTILHVATDGADGPDCGAEGSPCATLEGAAAKAAPGVAVQVHAGTYAADQYLSDLAGTADAPIWIGGAPGEERPLLSGGSEGVHLTRVRYLVLHDLEIQGATSNGVNIDDGGDYSDPEATRHLVVRGLHIHDIGQGGNQDCLKLSGLDDYVITGNELDHCGDGGSAIDHVGCHHGLLVGNHMHDNGGNAVQSKGGSDDIEIRGNLIVDSGQRGLNMGGSTGFEFFRPPLDPDAPNFEARDIRAIANVIVGSEAALAFVGCVDCLAANNTIVRPHNWIFRILQETVSDPTYEFLPASDSAFVNNLVVFERGDLSTYVNIGGDTAPETFIFATNLWYALDNPGQSSPAGDLPVAEVGAIAGEDPQLADLDGLDLHLLGGSPAIAAGTPDAALSADFDGVCYGEPPSIGAFEAP